MWLNQQVDLAEHDRKDSFFDLFTSITHPTQPSLVWKLKEFLFIILYDCLQNV